jgi:hypothetical protein
VRYEREKGLKDSSITRKLKSVAQYGQWAENQGFASGKRAWLHDISIHSVMNSGLEVVAKQLASVPATTRAPIGTVPSVPTASANLTVAALPKRTFKIKLPFWGNKSQNQKSISDQSTSNTQSSSGVVHQDLHTKIQEAVSKQNKNTLLTYLNLALLILFFLGLGVFGYRQLRSEVTPSLAFPSDVVRPNRTLSFQGRLTDTAQNPITTATNMQFRLYDALTSGNLLWDSGTCSVDPDQDGIFSTGLGDDCGAEIDPEVFSENANVWLEVQVASETLTPRQPIQTVAYAINSETVQGFPINATKSATRNTILVMNEWGEVVLGEVSPTIKSVAGTFSLEGQALTLQTVLGSNGDITLSPDGTGGVIITSPTTLEGATMTGYLAAPGATFSATYAGGTPLVVKGGPSGTANIQEWQNSSGGVLAAITSAGNAIINQLLGTSADPDLVSLGNGALTVNGTLTSTGTVNSSGGNLQTNGTDRITNAGNLTNIGTTQLNGVTYTWPGADAAGSGYALTSNGSGTLSWSSVATDSNIHWSLANGALFAKNSTVDLLIGGQSTASAKFAFINNNSGTPTATIAANLSLQVPTGSAPSTNLNVLNGGTLNIRTATTGQGDAGLATIATFGNRNVTLYGNRTGGGGLARALITQSGTSASLVHVNPDNIGASDTFNIFAADGGSLDYLLNVYGNGRDKVVIGGQDSTTNIRAHILTAADNYVGLAVEANSANQTANLQEWQNFSGVAQSWIDESGNLRLGSAAPDTGKLNVTGAFIGKALAIFNETGDQDIFTASASGTTRFVIQNDGDVGIGTNAPTSDLDIVTAPGTGPRITLRETSGGTSWQIGANIVTGSADEFAIYDNGNSATRFLIDNSGNVGINTTSPDTFLNIHSSTTSNVRLTNSSATNLLEFGDTDNTYDWAFFMSGSNALSLWNNNTSSNGLTLSSSNILTLPAYTTNGGILYTNGSGTVSQTAAGTAGQCLVSAGGGAPIWTSCSSAASNYWQLNNGAVSLFSNTLDLLAGGTSTASAKFAVLNMNTGTPVASISANSGNIATYITGDGTLATTNRNNLTIGNSSTYNTSGNVLINPNGTGRVGIGTTTPTAALETIAANGYVVNFARDASNYFRINDTAFIDIVSNNNSNPVFKVTGNGTADLVNIFDGATEVFTILDGGNVGIGDTTPVSKLSIGEDSSYNGTLYLGAVGANANRIANFGNSFEITRGAGPTWTGQGLRVDGTNRAINLIGSSSNVTDDTVFSLDAGATSSLFNNPSSGNKTLITTGTNATFMPTSGTATYSVLDIRSTINQTGGANGITRGIYINPTLTAAANWRAIDIANNSGYGIYQSGASATNYFAGNVGIGTTSPGTKLTINGDLFAPIATFSANYAGGRALTVNGIFDANDQVDLGDGGEAITLNGSSITLTGFNSCTSLETNGSGVLSCGTDDTGTGGTSYWRQVAGAISPTNDTNDVLIGNVATDSAKFKFLNVNTGTPVASISANSGNISTYITGDGTLATTNRNNLTIGNSSTYNTTGNILLNPNGTGNVGIGLTNPSYKLDVAGSMRAVNTTAQLTLGYDATKYFDFLVTSNGDLNIGSSGSSAGDEIDFWPNDNNNRYVDIGQGSSSGTKEIRLFQTGNNVNTQLSTNGNSYFNALAGNVGVGTTNPGAKLTINGDLFAPIATFSANYAGGTALTAKGGPSGTANIFNIQDSASNNLAFFNSAGDLTFNAQNDLRLADADSTNYIALQSPAVVGSNLTYTLPSTVTNGYIMQTDGSGTLSWVDPAAATGYWRLSNGALSPNNNTLDLLVGSNATSSAKFAVLNVNTGTPVASISANSGDIATYITGDGTLATTNRQNLIIGNSSTYNTTGNILLNPNGTGRVGIGTTSPTQLFHVYGSGDAAARIETSAGSYMELLAGGNHNRLVSDDPFRIQAQGAYAAYFYSTGIQGSEVTTGTYNILTNTSSLTVPAYSFVGDTDTGIGRGGANLLSLIAGGVNGLNVDGSGNVGVGTSSINSRLHVQQSTDTSSSGLTVYNTAGTRLMALWSDSSNNARIDSGSGGNSTIALNGAGTGNVGIGLLTAGARLDVRGDIFAPIATFSANFAEGVPLTLKGGPSGTGNILNIQNSSSTNLAFFNSTGDLTINSQGDLRLADADSTNYIALQAPSTVSSNITYTLPGTVTDGYLLQTDGSGTLSWVAAGTNYWQLNNGVLSPFSLTTDINLGDIASGSAKISLAGSLTRGKAVAIFNQTEDQDIIAASASGTTRFRVDQNGYVHGQRFVDIANSSYYLDPAATDTSLTVVGNVGIGTSAPVHQFQVSGSNDGKALAALNETGTNDIFTASSSGSTRFTIDNSGNVTVGNSISKDVDLNLYGDLIQQANTDLTAMSNVVDVFVYDTTKDSDGGKWTDDATARLLSWYTEAKDDGHGDACVPGTDDRCGKGAFPKKAVIVATTSDVYIFDAISNTMWMRFTQTGGTYALGADTNNNPSSVRALNGVVYVATNGSSGTGLYAINFRQDKMFRYNATDLSDTGTERITDRNTAVTYGNGNTVYALNSSIVNDVHPAVINGSTYVAVATDIDASVIRPDAGKVFDYSGVSSTSYSNVWLTKKGHLYATNTGLGQIEKWRNVNLDLASEIAGTPDFTWDESSVPSPFGTFDFADHSVSTALYVDEGASINGSDVIYIPASLAFYTGATAIYDVDGMERAGWVKHYSGSRFSGEIISETDGYWPFDAASSNLIDISGQGNDLEDEVSPTFDVRGVRNTALAFDGTSDHLCSTLDGSTCGVDADFSYGTTPFYISVWFKHSTSISGTDVLIDKTYTTTPAIGDGFRVWMNSTGNMVFGVDDDATAFPEDSVTSTGAYNDGQWHHLVAVKSGDQSPDALRLYIDGEEAGPADTTLSSTTSISDSSTILSVGSDCSVGAACATGANFWDGSIDELSLGRVSSANLTYQSLTQDTIRSMYLSGKQALQHKEIEVTNATTATSTTIGDSGESWTPNELVGQTVTLTGGTGLGQTRKIIQNTATVITVSPAFSTTPDTTTDFAVYPHRMNNMDLVDAYNSFAVSGGSNGQAKTLYIGGNGQTFGNGAVFAIRLDGDYITDVFHGDGGKTDDTGTAWDTSSNSDRISAISASSDVLAIGSGGLYWQQYEARSITEKIDSLTNQANTINNALPSAITNNHTQDNGVNRAVGYQVMRKGWGAIVTTAATSYTETVNYGITYEETPVVFTAINGRTSGNPPTSLEDCQGAAGTQIRGANAELVNKSDFSLRMFRSDNVVDVAGLDLCYSWMSIGTYSQGAAANPYAGVSPWANGADLAEWYATDDTSLDAGEIVSIDKSGTIKVVRSGESYDPAAIGIIATQPALTLGPDSGLTPGYKEDEFSPSGKAVQVALAGRVPVKVTLEGGPIKAGDPLTSSSTPGYAMKATGAGPIIGKAMDDFDGSSTITTLASENATSSASPSDALLEGTGSEVVAADPAMAELAQGRGVVMAFVNTSWYDPDPLLEDTKDFKIKSFINDKLEVMYELYKQMETGTEDLVDRIGAFGEIIVANLKAGSVFTQELIAKRATVEESLTSPVVETDLITPTSSGSGNLVINLARPNSATTSGGPSELGKLLLNGNLEVTGDASVAGNLTTEAIDAKSARIETLEGRLAQLEQINAETAEIVNATISGTLYANEIAGFEDKIAAALEEPSLLSKLLTPLNTTSSASTSASINAAIAAAQNAGYSTDETSTASSSANLNLELSDLNLTANDVTLLADATFINDYFKVNGNAYIAQSLGLGDSLLVDNQVVVGKPGDSLTITNNSLHFNATTTSTFAIQPSGQGTLSLMAGLLTLNDQGQAYVSGDLTVAGKLTVQETLLTDLLTPTDFANPLQVQLATRSGQVAGATDTVQESRFEIINELGTPVATISAQGKASFEAGIGVGTSGTTLSEDQTSLTTTKTAGIATIKAGTSEITIKSNTIDQDTLLYLTPVGPTGNQVLYIKSKAVDDTTTPDSEAAFTVGFEQAVSSDIQFNWWMVN